MQPRLQTQAKANSSRSKIPSFDLDDSSGSECLDDNAMLHSNSEKPVHVSVEGCAGDREGIGGEGGRGGGVRGGRDEPAHRLELGKGHELHKSSKSHELSESCEYHELNEVGSGKVRQQGANAAATSISASLLSVALLQSREDDDGGGGGRRSGGGRLTQGVRFSVSSLPSMAEDSSHLMQVCDGIIQMCQQ